MDLYSNESKQITNLVQEWINHPEQELEATFGANGVVDSTIFLQIAQRLRMKGFQSVPQDDRLSIITPQHIRLSLQGLGVLQTYCRDDKLQGKSFTAMIKDRTSKDSTIDLPEYDVRIKSRREINLSRDDPSVKDILDKWDTQKKAFRLVRRWTFKNKGIRIDMSMVRSTPRNPDGSFKWVRSFLEHNIFKETPQYEVEVEMLREDVNETLAGSLKSLIGGIGEVLRAIQKNTILIRKSVASTVLKGYYDLVAAQKFRGVSPVTLEVQNMLADIQDGIDNIRTGYNVTDKADGLRTMGYVNKDGELFMVDMALNVYKTGLQNKKCANSLVDGEWVTMTKDEKAINHYLIFDIYYAEGGENVSVLPFVDITAIDTGNGRYNKMKEWYASWREGVQIISKGITDSNKLLVALKEFQFATPNNNTIFEACARILDLSRIYETDGLIITSNSLPLPQKASETFYQQFKWKPSSQNTIDFLINFERDPDVSALEKVTSGIHPKTGETIRYKTLRLFVGSDKDPIFDNPRNTVLFEQEIPKGKQTGRRYKPILFNPIDFPDTMANTCNLVVKVDPETGEEYVTSYSEADLEADLMSEIRPDEENKEQVLQRKMLESSSMIGTGEPIRDKSIVEMRYEPKNESGWRWIPIRVRHDKTERLIKGAKTGNYARTLNSEKVGNSVWNSIHNPVTITMIRTGAEEPTEEEVKELVKSRDTDVAKKYYERKASEEDMMLVRGMLDFHNKYIKNNVLYSKLLKGGGKSVLDVACGKGGDLYKWILNRARTVVGIDTAGENITNPQNGAYKRYLEAMIEFGPTRVPQIAFVIGNSSKNIISGEAGATPEERDILRSIFGRYEPETPVPKYIETKMAGLLRPGVDIAVCMFAIHYFFENKETLDGFIKNIAETVKVGGYFAGCAFDGDKVFNLLRGIDVGHSKSGKEGDVPIWTITKQYTKEDLTADDESVGLAIDVEFISIGTTHREYLVPFELLQKRLKEIGFELLEKTELASMGLSYSTNTFDASYQMAQKAGKKYVMSDSVKEFSFLNRWYIFKRVSEIEMEEVPLVQELPAEEGVGAEGVEGVEGAEGEGVLGKPAEEEEPAAAAANKTGAELPSAERKYTQAEIFRIGSEAVMEDKLKIRDIGSGRWLSLSAPFPIPDSDDESIQYPTIEHYMAGMRLKLASNKPTLARDMMSKSGKIHQEYLTKRRTEGGIKPESARDFELLAEEANMVKKALSKQVMNKYRVVFDDAKWASTKDDVLRNALQYRFENDKRFHDIVEAARNQGKYILYTVKSGAATSELGGVRSITTGKIEGQNKVGLFIMEIAGFRF